MQRTRRVAVVGARSQIGHFLLPRLRAAGYDPCSIGRAAAPPNEDFIHVFDPQRAAFVPPLAAVDAVISLAPLPTIDQVLRMASVLHARRVIAFGSTGTHTKADSSSPVEQDFVEQQLAAERRLRELSQTLDIAWTLFRPTMIYGLESDQNVAVIRTIVRRLHFFPLPRGARGQRQPVHADDLAAACVAALTAPATHNRAYDLGGGERLDYEDLVRRVFAAQGKRPIIFRIPRAAFDMLVAIAKHIPSLGFVRKEMVDRMYRDLIADNGPASADFGYAPRPFILDHRESATTVATTAARAIPTSADKRQ